MQAQPERALSCGQGNTATTYGGGVGVTKSPGARVQLLGSRVTGNSAVRGEAPY